jgi:hypothetical protein
VHMDLCIQDPRRKRFLGMLPRLQPRHQSSASFASIDRQVPVFATFTNAAPVYVEQLLNWAYHLRELQLPHVVVCLDTESEEIADSNGIPWLAVANKTTSEDVRNDHATFRAMVSRKVHACKASRSSFQNMPSALPTPAMLAQSLLYHMHESGSGQDVHGRWARHIATFVCSVTGVAIAIATLVSHKHKR